MRQKNGQSTECCKRAVERRETSPAIRFKEAVRRLFGDFFSGPGGGTSGFSAAIAFTLMLCFCSASQASQLAKWDLSTLTGGAGNFGPSPMTATASDANVSIGGLNGPGYYQFSSRATDTAGNVEAMHATADASTQLLASGLLAGEYDFYFGIDLTPNGMIDADTLHYDSVSVTVTP